jgi:DNA-binding transcriptional LysR family regulator
MKHLDLEAVQAFVLVADLKNFTRAAEAMGSTQSAVSLKLKRLEAQLGRHLVDRTPRRVRLSADGEAFLEAARALVAAQERAIGTFEVVRARMTLGISHHIVGPDLPSILKRVGEQDPGLVIELRVESSDDVLRAFEGGAVVAALTRRHAHGRRAGVALMKERCAWCAAPGWSARSGEPLRIAAQSATCGLRLSSTRALDAAGIAWTEVFVGGSVATIGAAVSAGLATAALSRRCAPGGAIDVTAKFSLPPLPPLDVVLHSRLADARSRAALRSFIAALRATSDR